MQEKPEGVHVRSCSTRAAGLFRCAVREGARDAAVRIPAGLGLARERAVEPEPDHFGHSLVRDEDVAWFQVPMGDADAMRRLEAGEQSVGDLHPLGAGALFPKPVPEVLSVHELHRSERTPLGVSPDFGDARHVGVVHFPEQLQVASKACGEPPPERFVGDLLQIHHRDGDHGLVALVLSLPNGAGGVAAQGKAKSEMIV